MGTKKEGDQRTPREKILGKEDMTTTGFKDSWRRIERIERSVTFVPLAAKRQSNSSRLNHTN